jgi:hypothetical protein
MHVAAAAGAGIRLADMDTTLPVVVSCPRRFLPRVRYVLDTLFMAVGIELRYLDEAPTDGVWLSYGHGHRSDGAGDRRVAVPCSVAAWEFLEGAGDVTASSVLDDLPVILPHPAAATARAWDLSFDLVANAFFFLTSWSERRGAGTQASRQLFENSVYARLGLPQDVVDRYLHALLDRLDAAASPDVIRRARNWPGDRGFAVVLSHDVDFIPSGIGDMLRQGAKTMLRHLVRERDPMDALRAGTGLVRALVKGKDPYGCIPEIIEHERRLGVKSSFQVAVARHHPNDVNYDFNDEKTREYLSVIPRSGFDLCLHGSYLSTRRAEAYVGEAEVLRAALGAVEGSRQHFLSFDYDTLFCAQEAAGIEYDMSLGYPDRSGPRVGFSYPFFPYDLSADRPFNVVQLPLFLMDVTLRIYMGLKGDAARDAVRGEIARLAGKGGCVSAVWHPIVFGGARDPGIAELYWDMVTHISDSGGLATDGRTINRFWRSRATGFGSFAGLPGRTGGCADRGRAVADHALEGQTA